jgi:hypothetical protein
MGVSVRKRAIKIIRDLFTSNPNFVGATCAFIEIISRVNDDESSIQVAICRHIIYEINIFLCSPYILFYFCGI